MNAVLIETKNYNPMNTSEETAIKDKIAFNSVTPAVEDLAFEIGLWLSGLESFLSISNHSFTPETRKKSASRDWSREFRLTQTVLLLCSNLTFQIHKILLEKKSDDDAIDLDFEVESFMQEKFEIGSEEVQKLSQVLKNSILLNDGLLRSAPLKFSEWTAWSAVLQQQLRAIPAFGQFVATAEKEGERFLPDALRTLLDTRPLPLALKSDLQLILPRFGKILKWLSIVDRMLKQDEPLKPSLLIFSRIYEQINEMISFVNNRLLRLSEENEELFGSLDGAAYTASIELRKVYEHELAGVAEVRQSPLIYAKIETAHSLLNDSFQQTLLTFAQLLDPSVDPTKLFPNFQSKLKESVLLRRNLWQMLKSVQTAEQNPEKAQLEILRHELTAFLNNTLHFLFYKDIETVERFIEEVLVTTDKKDLVPILHRFGAYIETLFGQVNMRAVLANRPFDPDAQ